MTGPDAAGGAPGAVPAASDRALTRVVREESGRIVAALTAWCGSIDVAEEAVAQAVEDAVRTWREGGIPPNPGGWLTLAAKHDAIDRMRREKRHRDALSRLAPTSEHPVAEAEADERLALLFGCCHPALSPEAQLALTLRAIVGLTTDQIARATFSARAAVQQRIVRAKRKIAAAGVPLRVPPVEDRAGRLDLVLTVVSTMYASAHLVEGGDSAADRDVADDALWLAQVVAESLPREAEAHGLLALLRFHRAREPARSVDGELILLVDQDRSQWDAALVASGRAALDRAAVLRSPGRYQLHAAIATCHMDAATADETDWLQVLTLYDVLLAYDPSPIVRLNRVVALAQVDPSEAALSELDAIADQLAGFHLWHAVRAHVLRGLGHERQAEAEDIRALELTANRAEQRVIMARLTV